MSCSEWTDRVAAWHAGTLTETEARALEAHAAACPGCAAALEAAPPLPRPAVPPLPDALRATVLGAVAARRARRHTMRVAGMVAVAAVAVIAVQLATPRTKSGQDRPNGASHLLAADRARPQFAALDRAERELEAALRDAPGDTDLAGRLRTLRESRGALQRLVRDAAT